MSVYKFVVLFFSLLCASIGYADLTPLSDDQLSQSTGQAFLQIDRTSQDSNDFTRFTFGMDVETSLNADLVELGNYVRDGNAGADIRINDFALGSVNSDGSLNPFSIKDPFFELAFEDVNGKEELVGVRLGFGEAQGKLSGNIESLTGNIEVALYGTGSYLSSQMSCAWYDIICGIAKAAVGGTYANREFAATAQLVNPNNGEPQPIRATHVGLLNGQTLSIPSGNSFDDFLLGLFSSSNCTLLGTKTCFPLSNYRTLDVGDVSTGAAAKGMFLSFQSKNVTWYDAGVSTTARSGAFMNIPNGGIRTSFPDAFSGIQRVRTKMLDPYYD